MSRKRPNRTNVKRNPRQLSAKQRVPNRRLSNRRRRYRTGESVNQANQQLRQFRQASILALAITSLLLTVFSGSEPTQAQTAGSDTIRAIPDTVAIIEEIPTEIV